MVIIDCVGSTLVFSCLSFQVLALAIKRYKWQLSQVPKDISRLQILKEKHISDPFEFLRQVKHRVMDDQSGRGLFGSENVEQVKERELTFSLPT